MRLDPRGEIGLADGHPCGKMQKASSMLMIPDYFHFRLTGKKVQEYTNATTTGLVNATTHEWDQEIIDKLGLKRELFSRKGGK